MVKGKPATAEPSSGVARLMGAFHAAYVRRWNPPEVAEPWLAWVAAKKQGPCAVTPTQVMRPVLTGKDAKLFQGWLGAWSEEQIVGAIDYFFGEARLDRRVVTSNHDVGALYALKDYLLARRHQPADERTTSNLDAARRAMQRRS